jgi:hypothetical protein
VVERAVNVIYNIGIVDFNSYGYIYVLENVDPSNVWDCYWHVPGTDWEY